MESVKGELMSQTFRFIVGGAIWCLFAYGALTTGNQVVAGMFWVGTLILIGGGLYRMSQQNKAATPKPQEIRDVPVTLCLKPAQQSPSLNQAFAALPEYCLPLFERHSENRVPTTY